MEVMIQELGRVRDLAGGAGTVQELFALMIFKRQQNPLMMNKPVVYSFTRDAAGIGFWDPLIDLLDGMCQPGDFVVAHSLDDVVPVFEPKLRMSA
ncbi:MAG: hypothetical protein QM755_18295 [Luteolibacter sp.]